MDYLICITYKHSGLKEDKIQRDRQPDERPSRSLTDKKKRKGDHQKEKPFETSYREVNTMFKEPIYKVLSNINDKPFFKWPKAMPSDPSRRDPELPKYI